MKKLLFLLILSLCLLLAVSAFPEALEAAEEAPELTSSCVFTSASKESKQNTTSLMTDRNVSTYYALKEGKGWLIVESPEPIFGVSVMLNNRYGRDYSYDLQIEGPGGE